MKQALYDLGVRDDTLTRQEKKSLDNEGYLPLHGILTKETGKRYEGAYRRADCPG